MSSLAALGFDLCDVAAATPPKGVKSNFIDPPTFAPVVIAVSAIMMTSAISFTAGRLFANWKELTWSDRRLQYLIWAGIITNFATYFTGIPVNAYYQAPSPGHSWYSVMLSGKPDYTVYWGLVQSTLGIILDLYIFIIPLPIIYQLNLWTRKRIYLAAVFSTAFFVVELNVAIIVCSMPGFVKFVRLHGGRWASAASRWSKNSTRGESRSSSGFSKMYSLMTGRTEPLVVTFDPQQRPLAPPQVAYHRAFHSPQPEMTMLDGQYELEEIGQSDLPISHSHDPYTSWLTD
ncbi:hypothetical protein VM1G_04542 [Cytospora mali]|uniref:Rhodopsin domain-containing protein n=1 Tax=Cytospora mali TaxID=578113 RepID=A0A194VV53_CYTMA|nr:hypothetical protein VM1G_04542 [Valsa mali]